ncbi:metallophosphoesterase [Candidatus Fukatsuia symbiotica]|uniref:metallophosphoesterase n=1 Tax=Candidatus Fukatsuia symbiotica TaxID=1878942 RepID=UPI0013C4E316|nr:metallophosphoesterase [Candidatus Fukatsuia symbiotica]
MSTYNVVQPKKGTSMGIINFFHLRKVAFICSFLIVTGCTDKVYPEKTVTFITISDLHFNPFYNCDIKNDTCLIIDKLQAAPTSQWKEILERYEQSKQIYNKDTNYFLFHSVLGTLKKRADDTHAQFVLLLGDVLAHDYNKNYIKYTGDTSSIGIQNFVNKTMQFITNELKNRLSSIDVYTVVGNNDTYSDHYTSEAVFYKNIAKIWSQSIKDEKNRIKMENDFSKGGYYSLELSKQKKLRLIVLNTNFFSTLGKGLDIEAKEELNWLHNELSSVHKKNQKAIIALHIPVGIDAYQSVIQSDVVSLWDPQNTQQFLSQLEYYSNEIIAIFSGHLHTDFFEIIKFNGRTKNIFLTGTPAVSPLFSNNPGFKLYRYSRNTLELQGYSTYYYPLDSIRPEWKLAYDSNKNYKLACRSCNLMKAMDKIKPSGELADSYQKFYMLRKDLQPITKENKWVPYYCAIRNLTAETYQVCLKNLAFRKGI